MGEHFIYIWSATKFRWWQQWAQAHAHGTNATSGHSERNQCSLTKRALTTSAYSSDLIRLSPFHLNIDRMIKGRMFKGKYDPFVRWRALPGSGGGASAMAWLRQAVLSGQPATVWVIWESCWESRVAMGLCLTILQQVGSIAYLFWQPFGPSICQRQKVDPA